MKDLRALMRDRGDFRYHFVSYGAADPSVRGIVSTTSRLDIEA